MYEVLLQNVLFLELIRVQSDFEYVQKCSLKIANMDEAQNLKAQTLRNYYCPAPKKLLSYLPKFPTFEIPPNAQAQHFILKVIERSPRQPLCFIQNTINGDKKYYFHYAQIHLASVVCLSDLQNQLLDNKKIDPSKWNRTVLFAKALVGSEKISTEYGKYLDIHNKEYLSKYNKPSNFFSRLLRRKAFREGGFLNNKDVKLVNRNQKRGITLSSSELSHHTSILKLLKNHFRVKLSAYTLDKSDMVTLAYQKYYLTFFKNHFQKAFCHELPKFSHLIDKTDLSHPELIRQRNSFLNQQIASIDNYLCRFKQCKPDVIERTLKKVQERLQKNFPNMKIGELRPAVLFESPTVYKTDISKKRTLSSPSYESRSDVALKRYHYKITVVFIQDEIASSTHKIETLNQKIAEHNKYGSGSDYKAGISLKEKIKAEISRRNELYKNLFSYRKDIEVLDAKYKALKSTGGSSKGNGPVLYSFPGVLWPSLHPNWQRDKKKLLFHLKKMGTASYKFIRGSIYSSSGWLYQKTLNLSLWFARGRLTKKMSELCYILYKKRFGTKAERAVMPSEWSIIKDIFKYGSSYYLTAFTANRWSERVKKLHFASLLTDRKTAKEIATGIIQKKLDQKNKEKLGKRVTRKAVEKLLSNKKAGQILSHKAVLRLTNSVGSISTKFMRFFAPVAFTDTIIFIGSDGRNCLYLYADFFVKLDHMLSQSEYGYCWIKFKKIATSNDNINYISKYVSQAAYFSLDKPIKIFEGGLYYSKEHIYSPLKNILKDEAINLYCMLRGIRRHPVQIIQQRVIDTPDILTDDQIKAMLPKIKNLSQTSDLLIPFDSTFLRPKTIYFLSKKMDIFIVDRKVIFIGSKASFKKNYRLCRVIQYIDNKKRCLVLNNIIKGRVLFNSLHYKMAAFYGESKHQVYYISTQNNHPLVEKKEELNKGYCFLKEEGNSFSILLDRFYEENYEKAKVMSKQNLGTQIRRKQELLLPILNQK